MTSFTAIFDRQRRPIGSGVRDRTRRAFALHHSESKPVLSADQPGFLCFESHPREVSIPARGRPFCAGANGVAGRSLGELKNAGPHENSDDLLPKALERFGVSVWNSIEGPFGTVVFDPGPHTLHLARDPLGQRPLFYREDGELITVSDRMELLLASGRQTPALDDSQLTRYLGLEPTAEGRTVFAGISELDPGCALEISARKQHRSRFWTPAADGSRRRLADDEYADRFTELLRSETEGLAGEAGEAGVMLSGGIDSTSIAVFAQEAARRSGQRSAACSWVFDDLVTCDERAWIDQTLATRDFEVVQVSGDECWPLVDLDLFSTLPGTPDENPYRALKTALYKAAGQAERRLLLNGGPADIFYRGAGLYLRDLLRSQRWRTALGCLYRQMRTEGWRPAAGAVGRVVRPSGRRKRRRAAPEWLTARSRKIWCAEFAEGPEMERGPRDVVPYLAIEGRGLAIENRYSEGFGIQVASPYWTKGWIEFMLALPAHQVYRPGVTKFVARRAMRGVVPETIRRRQQPTLLDPLFDRGVFDRERAVVHHLLHEGSRVWPEFVESDFVREIGPQSPATHKLLLWQCLSLELWREKHGWNLA